MSATLTTMAVLAIAAASGHPSSTNSQALMHPFPDALKQVKVVNPTCAVPVNHCIPCEQTPAIASLPVSTMADKPHTNKTCNVRPLSKKKAQQLARREKFAREAALKEIQEAPKEESPYKKCQKATDDCLERRSYFDFIRGLFYTTPHVKGAIANYLVGHLTTSEKGMLSRCQGVFEDCMTKEWQKK